MRELDLLRHIYASNPALPGSVTIPPGDDMGAVNIGGTQVLVTVDQVADGLHFTLRDTPIELVGRKAITRNLSDVAAMGARPAGAVATACLPRGMDPDQAKALFDAMHATARRYDCPLFGGDIAFWDHPLLITVTILADPAGVAPVLRRGARVGDVVCVTGELGGSYEPTDRPGRHLTFEPRLAIARQLASHRELRPHAMIDLSDGLARDLGHICRASGVAAELWADALPISPEAHARAHRLGDAPWQHALGDGEDYELCFTLPAREAHTALPTSIDGVPITRVGVIVPAGQQTGLGVVAVRMSDGLLRGADELGWEYQT